jgi:DDE family transposase
MVRQHGWTRRRVWKSQLIVSAVLTDKSCSDDKVLSKLLDDYSGKYHQISADGAYDSHDCIEDIAKRGARAVISLQSHPRHKPKIKDKLKNTRDEIAWQIQQSGKKEWKQQSGYHRRSLAETGFYRYKQLLGNKLSLRKFENQQVEAMLRCHMLNQITLGSMPISVAI